MRSRSRPLLRRFATVLAICVFAALGTGCWKDTETPSRHASEADPRNQTAQDLLASQRLDERIDRTLALWAQGKRPEGLAEIDEAIRLAPGSARAHLTRGQLLEESGEVGEARRSFERALELRPDYVEARMTLARLLVRTEELESAERELRRAVADAPGEAEAHRGLALVLIARGELAEALAHAREALRLRPGWPLAMGDLAWILARIEDPKLRDPQQAVAFGEKAARASGEKHAGILDSLAAAYAAAGRFEDAAASAEKALQLALKTRDDAFATRVARRLLAYREKRVDRETPR